MLLCCNDMIFGVLVVCTRDEWDRCPNTRIWTHTINIAEILKLFKTPKTYFFCSSVYLP